jgi:hypothetical protein
MELRLCIRVNTGVFSVQNLDGWQGVPRADDSTHREAGLRIDPEVRK